MGRTPITAVRRFEAQQPLLRIQPAAEPVQTPVAPDHAMTGEDDRERVAAVRRADRPHGGGAADSRRLLGVCARLAVGDLAQCAPCSDLECRPREIEWELEARPPTGEILVE